CNCAVCEHFDELKLKIIAHSGRAVFHSIGGRAQVSGTDVILAHRLLKNSVPDKEYLLLTDAAYREFGGAMGLSFEPGVERYDGFGAVETHVHYLNDEVEHERTKLFAL